MQVKSRHVKALCALLVAVLAAGLLFGGEGADAKRRRRGGRGGRGGGGGVIIEPVRDPADDPQDPADDPQDPQDPQDPNVVVGDKPFTVQYARQSGQAAPEQSVRVTANCPSGTKVIGGGAFHPGPTPKGMLTSSSPFPALNAEPSAGWTAELTNVSQETQTLNVTAVCASGTGLNVQYVKASTAVAPASGGVTSAVCPGGTQLTGGGAFMDALPGAGRLNTSTANGLTVANKGWVAYVNNVSGDQAELTVTAICASAPNLSVQYVRSADLTMPAYQVAGQYATCPTGTKVLGGGASISGTAKQGYINGSMPYPVDAATPTLWAMNAGNLGSTPLAIAVTAICAAAG